MYRNVLQKLQGWCCFSTGKINIMSSVVKMCKKTKQAMKVPSTCSELWIFYSSAEMMQKESNRRNIQKEQNAKTIRPH